jgi:hypothetical protein
MEHGDRALDEHEVDALFDTAVAFAEGGLERVRVTQTELISRRS